MSNHTGETDVIYNYSSLSNVQITGRNLTVMIHNAEDPEDVMGDLLMISSTPLIMHTPVAANAA